MLLSTFGNYVNVRFALIYAAVLLNVAAARMFENDVCSMKDSSLGTCRVDRECTAVLDAIRRGEMSARDPVHCGFKGSDELICCPSQGVVDQTNKDDDGFIFESTRTTTPRATTRTTPTRTPSSSPTNRLGERPAVAACRLIDEQLSLDLTPQILDGTPVELGEYPHMAAIGYTAIGNDFGPYEFRCGGTLIQRQFILTAAHCVSSRESTPTIVRLGAVNFTDPVELRNAVEVRIKEVHVHPNYSNLAKVNDVALLELEREVTFVTNRIFPTCLYDQPDDPAAKFKLFVTGFGEINTTTHEVSNTLLKARVQIVPLERCNISFTQQGRSLRPQHLCAIDPGFTKDACQGDSGGPLNLVLNENTKQYRVLGIIFTGFGCATAIPGLYTRVSSFLDYIESIVWPEGSTRPLF